MTNVEVGGSCSGVRRSSEGKGCMKLEVEVQNRDQWRAIVIEAKFLMDCSASRRRRKRRNRGGQEEEEEEEEVESNVSLEETNI